MPQAGGEMVAGDVRVVDVTAGGAAAREDGAASGDDREGRARDTNPLLPGVAAERDISPRAGAGAAPGGGEPTFKPSIGPLGVMALPRELLPAAEYGGGAGPHGAYVFPDAVARRCLATRGVTPDVGVRARGALSPLSPVTLSAEERRGLAVPAAASASHYCYPADGAEAVPAEVGGAAEAISFLAAPGKGDGDEMRDEDSAHCPTARPRRVTPGGAAAGEAAVAALLLGGGFVFLDDGGDVIAAIALGGGPPHPLAFAGPFPWRPAFTAGLADARRFRPAAAPTVRAAGARHVAFFRTGETFSGDGERPWVIPGDLAIAGGFILLYGDTPAAPDPRDAYFVAATEAGGRWRRMQPQDYALLRRCPVCKATQSLSETELAGMMRCGSCEKLSRLKPPNQQTARNVQGLLMNIARLFIYIITVSVYCAIGGAIYQAIEEGPDADRIRAEQAAFLASLRALNASAVADSLAVLDAAGGDAGAQLDAFRGTAAGAVFAGCVPAAASRWASLENSMFFASTIITTIGYGSFAPTQPMSRLFTFVYGIFGIAVVSACIFDLAEVVPQMAAYGMKLCRMPPSDEQQTTRASREMEDVFQRHDMDGTGTLSLQEFAEYLDALTPETDIDHETAKDVMEQVDDGDGRLTRDEATQAVALWYRLEAERAKHTPTVDILLAAAFLLVQVITAAWAFHDVEHRWTYQEGMWFWLITVTTIGLGDFTPATNSGYALYLTYTVLGLATATWMMGALASVFAVKVGGGFADWLLSLPHKVAPLRRLLRRLGLLLGVSFVKGDSDAVCWTPVDTPVFFRSHNAEDEDLARLALTYPAEFECDGHQWASVVHYFTCMRFGAAGRGADNLTALQRQLKDAADTDEVRRIAQKRASLAAEGMRLEEGVERPDWLEVRDNLMLTALACKFDQCKPCRDALLRTGERELVFDNEHSEYWGVGAQASGQNRLGELLATVRDDIRNGRTTDKRLGTGGAVPVDFFAYTNMRYAALSLIYPTAFTGPRGLRWPSVAHYFTAAQFAESERELRDSIRAAESARAARQIASRALKGGAAGGSPRAAALRPVFARGQGSRAEMQAMQIAQVLKFSQNTQARHVLLSTGRRELRFCDPADAFWGTGKPEGPGAAAARSPRGTRPSPSARSARRATGRSRASPRAAPEPPPGNRLGVLLAALRDRFASGAAPRELEVMSLPESFVDLTAAAEAAHVALAGIHSADRLDDAVRCA